MASEIIICGACQHNLKNLSLALPKGKLIVFTGPSGSGKTSLAFDTLYAEGQRRYVESLSAYARQFLDIAAKPDVDKIEGLSPAISIEQKNISKNPRSTVGTVTEIYDYLRLLFARVGTPYSPTTGQPISAQSRTNMLERIQTLSLGTRFYLFSPIVRGMKGEFRKELIDLQKRGYDRLRIDGQIYELAVIPSLEKNKHHTIEVLIDRLVVEDTKDFQERVIADLESALILSDGLALVESADAQFQPFLLSSKMACPVSGFSLGELEPRLFSFNNPFGACPACNGIGTPFGLWAEAQEECDEPEMLVCSTCQGFRLKPEALCVKIADRHIGQVCELSLEEMIPWTSRVKQTLSPSYQEVAERILKEITNRLTFLLEVGLGYLTLSRRSATLSGGESQRIRLASQVGSGLTGVLYVLDEPSIGLHQRDNARLLQTLFKLKGLDNTVIVVEHDEDTIRLADYIVDFGPGAGRHGGNICAQGDLSTILASSHSLTGAYLSHQKKIQRHSTRIPTKEHYIRIIDAHVHNLKHVDVHFPIGHFICVTGVSGSGKSSLVMDTLCRGVKALQAKQHVPAACGRIEGMEHIDKLISITQDPIGRTSRSNPATYTGAFTPIREWFSWLPEARARGYGPGRFSFNLKGGRCEACQGEGTLTISMHFLPDMHVPCDQCKGQRYSRETLDIRYKDKSIADVLALSIEEALLLFEAIPSIVNGLNTLVKVGLGYLSVGQSAPTLSGGEAQRVKLAKELSRRATGRTLYILDEPTTGLHFQDIQHLLNILHLLVDQGNTVVVIEHNLEVIKTADWIIDMGPEGGHKGGSVVAAGSPSHIMQEAYSYTGQYLASL